MKLRRSERSFEQRSADQSVGLYPWAADEFAFNRDMTEISLPCSGGRFSRCILKITTGEAKHPVWHWDGNEEAPTLTPSIGCEHRCGWHGHLTKGELSA